MDFIAEIQTPLFWTGLMTIIWVNIILSGDNAVVIALAARSLPKHQQNKAVFWGAGAAVVMRIVLTIVAVETAEVPLPQDHRRAAAVLDRGQAADARGRRR